MTIHSDANQILIGTCVPGKQADAMMPAMLEAGFETISINFHMEYAGIDLTQQGPRLKGVAEEKGGKISTLGYYCNPLENDNHLKALEKVIDSAHLYGATIVSTFAGAYEGRPVEEAFPQFGKVFGELARRAEDRGVKLAIENCPMGGNWHRATCNIAFHPRAWENMFNEVDNDALGLEWEPAHQMVQLIDPIAQLRKWVGKIHHVHGKDATIDRRSVEDEGVFCGDGNYAQTRTPGFGDCNWRDIIYILRRGGYTADICVEGFHDPLYKDSLEMTGQIHALGYLKFCRGGQFTANPWQ